MEPTAKRQRLGLLPDESEGEDELDFDPEELNQRRDPGYQLEQARDRAVNKLKSRFENIFAKYGQDFTGVGDEIDLRTGQVVVDNGHLESLQSVKELGDGEEEDEYEEEEERIMHGRRITGEIPSSSVVRKDPWAVEESNPNRSPLSPMMGGPRFSTTMFPSHNSYMTPPRSFDSFGSGSSLSVDTAWQAPELPRSAFMGGWFGTPGRQYSFRMGSSTRKTTMRALPAPRDQDEEDEDVLLGVSGNVLKRKEPDIRSPLIKEKFPPVDSSPNKDPGLNELIREVIENIPETPPSVQRPDFSALASIQQLSEGREPSQSKSEHKGKPPGRPWGRPRGTSTGGTCKKGPTGSKLDLSQNSCCASTSGSPTRLLNSTSKQKSLAGRADVIEQHSEPGGDTSSFQEGDRETYQDVTGMPAINLDTNAFYIEIEARNLDGLDVQGRPRAEMINKKSIGKEDDNAKPSTVQDNFERNVIDSAFAFSDEETLPPRKPRINRHKLEPAKFAAPQVLQAPRSSLLQPRPAKYPSQRNAVDPSYAFSDEENLLPRRAMTTRRKSEAVVSSTLTAEEALSTCGNPHTVSVPVPKEAHGSPTERKRRRRSMRTARKPVAAADEPVDRPDGLVSSNALPTESESAKASPAIGTDALKPRTRRSQGHRPTTTPVSVHRKQSADQEAEAADTESSAVRPPSVRRSVGRPKKVERIASPELGEPAFLGAADTTTEEVEKQASETEPPPTATPAPPQQPSTPKSRFKTTNKNTPSSKPGLISLLSDNEDDEDEISFDLSAFTPSGHHRILTHGPRSSHTTTTTPHISSRSTASKKKRASSHLFGPSSTSKIRKHRTPGSRRKDGKGTRRGSTNSLARSVVKVRRQSFRAPSPAASVVQTPGGTKRRCGQDGFSCERDFCFVCISI